MFFDVSRLPNLERYFVERVQQGLPVQGALGLDAADDFWRERLSEEKAWLENANEPERGAILGEISRLEERLERRGFEGPLNETEWIIRAELIKALYLGSVRDDTISRGEPTPVRITGAGIVAYRVRIAGPLDLGGVSNLDGAALPGLKLENCLFDHEVGLQHASFSWVSLRGSRTPGLRAEGCRVAGELRLEALCLMPQGQAQVATVDLTDADLRGALYANELTAQKPIEEIDFKLNFARVRGMTQIRARSDSRLRELKSVEDEIEPARSEVRIMLEAKSARLESDVDLFRSTFRSIDFWLASINSQLLMQRCICRKRDVPPRGATTGRVWLSYCHIGGYLDCTGVEFDELNLRGARIDSDVLLSSIADHYSQITETLVLSNAMVRGNINLNGCQIGSGVEFSHGLFADLLRLDGNLDAGLDFDTRLCTKIQGTVYFERAQIGNNLSFNGTTIESGGELSFNAQGLKVGGNLIMGGAVVPKGTQSDPWSDIEFTPFVATNGVSALRAVIDGALSMRGARVAAPTDEAVDFSMSKIGTGVFIRSEASEWQAGAHQHTIKYPGLTTKGGVRFHGAEIGSGFHGDGAKLVAAGKGQRGLLALDLREARITGSVHLGRADRLIEAAVIGNDETFQADGTVALDNVSIEGNLDLGNARVGQTIPDVKEVLDINRHTIAVSGEGAKVTGRVVLGRRQGARGGAHYFGEVCFDRVEIGGDLMLTGASLQHHYSRDDEKRLTIEPRNPKCLSLHNARVTGDLIVEDIFDERANGGIARHGVIDLRGSTFALLRDRYGRGWGPTGTKANHLRCRIRDGKFNGIRLRLTGSRYQGFDEQRLIDEQSGERVDVGYERICWLERQFPRHGADEQYYAPQNHLQVERAFIEAGRISDARRVAITKNSLINELAVGGRGRRLLNWLYGAFFGFGFLKRRALLTLFFTLLIGYGLAQYLIAERLIVSEKAQREQCALGPISLAVEATRPAMEILSPTMRRASDGSPCRLSWHPHAQAKVIEVFGTRMEVPPEVQKGGVQGIAYLYVVVLVLVGYLSYRTTFFGYKGPID